MYDYRSPEEEEGAAGVLVAVVVVAAGGRRKKELVGGRGNDRAAEVDADAHESGDRPLLLPALVEEME